MHLAATGNPSVLMALWAPVEYAIEDGYALQALGPLFIGRHVIPRYRGYMQSQAEGLLGVRGGGGGRRGGGGREELISQFGYDTKYAMHCARLGFQCQELLTTGKLALPIQGEPAEWLLSVRKGQVSFAEWWDRTLGLDASLESPGVGRIAPGWPRCPCHREVVRGYTPQTLDLVVRRGFGDASVKDLTSANTDRTTPIISTTDH